MKFPDDPIIRDMVPEFIEWWLNETTVKLREVLLDKDSAELFRFGHTLKGSGRQFGFDELATYGTSLEECSQSGNWEKAEAVQAEIICQLKALRVALPPSGAV